MLQRLLSCRSDRWLWLYVAAAAAAILLWS